MHSVKELLCCTIPNKTSFVIRMDSYDDNLIIHHLFLILETLKTLLSISGYDFGYLLKILTNSSLPADENEFFELLKLFFPNIYDVKYLMKSCKNLKVSCSLGVWNVSCHACKMKIGYQMKKSVMKW